MAKKDLCLLLFIVLGLCGITLASCEAEKPDCYQPVNVTTVNNFKIKDTLNTKDSLTGRDTVNIIIRDSLLLDLGMFSLDVDSLYGVIGAPEGTSKLSVPLNPNADSMRYRILYDTAQTTQGDTITFYYTSSVHFISNNCGYTYFYNLDSIHSTKNVLDSVSLVQRAVTNNQTAPHLLFYFFK